MKSSLLRAFSILALVSILVGGNFPFSVNQPVQAAPAIMLPFDSQAATAAAVESALPVAVGLSSAIQITGTITSTSTIYLPMMAQKYPNPISVFGVEMHSISDSNYLSEMEDTGTRWVRRNGFEWMLVEPSEGVYLWEDSYVKTWETELLNARQAGIEPIMVIRTTPEWARLGVVAAYSGGPTYDFSNSICGPINPDKYAAFGNFLHEVVKRYSGHPYYVRYFQLGNEPEAEITAVSADSPYGCWGWRYRPYFNGEAYGDMLASVYPRIKEANPQAQVVFGGLLLDCNPALAVPPVVCNSEPLKFLEGALYRHGHRDGANYFDVIAYHSYDFYYGLGSYGHPGWGTAPDITWNTQGPSLISKTSFVRSTLAKYNASDKPLMNTEGALLCGRDGSEDYCQTQTLELTKAYYLAEYFAVANSLGLKTTIWYSTSGWRKSGLFESGQPTLAYKAYQFSSRKLESAVFQRKISDYPNVHLYEFRVGNRTIWFAWSQDGANHDISLPGQPAKIWDPFGQEKPVTGNTLQITLMPLYIEW